MPATAEEPMSKTNKPKPSPPPAPFQVKLPGAYRKPLEEAEARHGRPMSVSVQVALEMYFRMLGIPFTPNYPRIELPKPPTD